jgi:hypothetical protein
MAALSGWRWKQSLAARDHDWDTMVRGDHGSDDTGSPVLLRLVEAGRRRGGRKLSAIAGFGDCLVAVPVGTGDP